MAKSVAKIQYSIVKDLFDQNIFHLTIQNTGIDLNKKSHLKILDNHVRTLTIDLYTVANKKDINKVIFIDDSRD